MQDVLGRRLVHASGAAAGEPAERIGLPARGRVATAADDAARRLDKVGRQRPKYRPWPKPNSKGSSSHPDREQYAPIWS